MSSKFVIGDHVRITNPLRDEFDRTGVVTAYAEIQCEAAAKVMLTGTDLELIFRHTSLTLADPERDAHAVLAEMDAESAAFDRAATRAKKGADMAEMEIDGYEPGASAEDAAKMGIWELPDPVNHPAHYTSHPSGVECLTITRHMGFNLGNAMKYVWRADLKGAAIQDLEKAAFYIQDEIAKRKAAQ